MSIDVRFSYEDYYLLVCHRVVWHVFITVSEKPPDSIYRIECWIWRQQLSSKHLKLVTTLHGVTYQKTAVIFYWISFTNLLSIVVTALWAANQACEPFTYERAFRSPSCLLKTCFNFFPQHNAGSSSRHKKRYSTSKSSESSKIFRSIFQVGTKFDLKFLLYGQRTVQKQEHSRENWPFKTVYYFMIFITWKLSMTQHLGTVKLPSQKFE
jgi:hypothetical protein